jgi:hydroxypyruvate reductase
MVLSTFIEGEAREVARVLAGLLREINASGHPFPRPCCLVLGGETTVTVRGQGTGGRNQELALAAAFALADVPDVLLASIGTDGNDGPTDAAGAWVDGTTLARARALGLDAAAYLADNNSYALFDRLGDLIRTGPTNTNVNDIMLLLAF